MIVKDTSYLSETVRKYYDNKIYVSLCAKVKWSERSIGDPETSCAASVLLSVKQKQNSSEEFYWSKLIAIPLSILWIFPSILGREGGGKKGKQETLQNSSPEKISFRAGVCLIFGSQFSSYNCK